MGATFANVKPNKTDKQQGAPFAGTLNLFPPHTSVSEKLLPGFESLNVFRQKKESKFGPCPNRPVVSSSLGEAFGLALSSAASVCGPSHPGRGQRHEPQERTAASGRRCGPSPALRCRAGRTEGRTRLCGGLAPPEVGAQHGPRGRRASPAGSPGSPPPPAPRKSRLQIPGTFLFFLGAAWLPQLLLSLQSNYSDSHRRAPLWAGEVGAKSSVPRRRRARARRAGSGFHRPA